MKDHEIAALVNSLRDVAVEFHDSQQLRERISQLIVPALATANERIRGLEAEANMPGKCARAIAPLLEDLTAEREVSDKLVAALNEMHRQFGASHQTVAQKKAAAEARATLSEVAAIRAKQGGEG